MNHRFMRVRAAQRHYSRPYRRLADFDGNRSGTAYTIDKMQDRGAFFVDPGEEVYAGQVIGEHTRQNDFTINIQKGKKLTNMRASGSDDNVKIAPAKQLLAGRSHGIHPEG